MNPLKVAHISKTQQPDSASEFAKILVAKWRRKDKEKAEKKYGVKLDDENENKKRI
jgi:hypothetical protein